MKRNHFRCAVSTWIVLLAIMACVLPGQTVVPVPTLNPFAIDTAVAGTAQAAAQQTEQANPFTATPTTAPTATITPTPKVSLAGTSLVIQEDQSTLFIDHKLGFQLVIPAGWLTTRVNEDEYFKAFTLEVVISNPPINDRLRHMQTNNTDNFRLNAVDIRPGHLINGMICDITVILQPAEVATTLEEALKMEKRHVTTSAMVGHKMLSSKYQQTTNGTRVLMVEETWNLAAVEGEKVFYRRVFFNLPSGIISLDFQAHANFKDVVLPDFEQAVNSLTMLTP